MNKSPFPLHPPDDPVELFQRWYRRAHALDPDFAHAMTLATVDAAGRPSARIVLMKDFGPEGLVFFTNYQSRKGAALAACGRVAVVFWWKEWRRQVRVEGVASTVTRQESEAYFATRPRGSQIGAWASQQSRPIPDRAVLAAKVRNLTTRFKGQTIPCPPHWGGYRIRPDRIEFWVDQRSRLHDRLDYQRGPGGRWTPRLLAP